MKNIPADFRRSVSFRGRGVVPDVAVEDTPPFREVLSTVASSELWKTSKPVDLTATRDLAPSTVDFPAEHEAIIRLIEFRRPEPRDDVAEKETLDRMFAATADAGATKGKLHRTKTLDYFTVISGEIALMSDEDEVEVGAGDTVICLGGMHAWECRTTPSARVFTVLVGAKNHGDTSSGDWPGQPARSGGLPGEVIRRVVLGHDAQGRSRILDDRDVRLPVHLWTTGAVLPDNGVKADPLIAELETIAFPESGTGFTAVEIPAGESRNIASGEHLLAGVVVDGSIEIASGQGPSRPTSLSGGDTFIAHGHDIVLHNVGTGAVRTTLVTIAGR